MKVKPVSMPSASRKRTISLPLHCIISIFNSHTQRIITLEDIKIKVLIIWSTNKSLCWALSKLITNLKLGLDAGNDEVNRKQDHHNGKASKHSDTKDHVQKDKSNCDLKRTGPEQPEIGRRIAHSLSIDRHQIHYLADSCRPSRLGAHRQCLAEYPSTFTQTTSLNLWLVTIKRNTRMPVIMTGVYPHMPIVAKYK